MAERNKAEIAIWNLKEKRHTFLVYKSESRTVFSNTNQPVITAYAGRLSCYLESASHIITCRGFVSAQ